MLKGSELKFILKEFPSLIEMQSEIVYQISVVHKAKYIDRGSY